MNGQLVRQVLVYSKDWVDVGTHQTVRLTVSERELEVHDPRTGTTVTYNKEVLSHWDVLE